jgi:hypothetical protein
MSIFDDLKRTFSGDYTPAAPQRPVLFGQETTEVVQDPLLKDLYFGSDQSPGFLNQLQQAGSRLIGQDVPLQQTAGLGNLERQALSQAQAGIGSYQPFLNQNQRLLNEAIAQSRRAESLQDPYLRGATGEIGQGLTSLLGSLSEARDLSRGAVSGYGRRLGESEDLMRQTLGGYDQNFTNQFYNPFEQQVVQQTIQDAIKANEMQNIGQRAADIAQGGESAFGSRARLSAKERQEAFGKGLGGILANIRAGGFGQAQQLGIDEFQRQQDARRQAASGLSTLFGQRLGAQTGLASSLSGYGQGEEAGRGRYAAGLMGIGQQRGATAAGLGQELAGYGGTLGQLGGYGQQLGQRQRAELMGLGSVPRGIQDARYQRQFAQQAAQQSRPLATLSGIGGLLPGYQPGQAEIRGGYGLPVDPLAAGLQGAMSIYGNLYKNVYPPQPIA